MDTREEKLVTPLLMNLDGNKKALAIHIYGDEKIGLWKRWGDGYNVLYGINRNRSGTYMEARVYSSIRLQLYEFKIVIMKSHEFNHKTRLNPFPASQNRTDSQALAIRMKHLVM